MKIDAHQHFWQYSPSEYGWIGPDMAPLKQDHLPADLDPLLEAIGFDGSVAVQARQSLAETQWLLELADQYSFIKGVVGWVDLQASDVQSQLAQFRSHPKLCGIRHIVQDEPDDRFMLREEFVRGLGHLSEFDLAYDILIFPRHLPVACELVAKFPKQRFVLDHMAKPLIVDKKVTPWDSDIRRLAAYPNVFCKLSGLVTEADWQHWQPDEFKPYLDVVFEAFGPDRLMVGSDWPVCRVAGAYSTVMQIVLAYLGQFSDAEQAGILGENARHFYKFSA